MSSSEEYRAQQAKLDAISAVRETWQRVMNKVNDGRPGEAVRLVEEGIKDADALGDDFTLSLYPVCLACMGYAEMGSPSESDRKVRCEDVPVVCKGNRYGRMHPVQLLDYVKGLLPPVAVPAIGSEDCSKTGGASGASGGEMRPTPAPPYVYSRSAVIAFNATRAGVGEPGMIPVPEEDEEVLAHADGTFTVRKIGG